jgi:hypothetical protein
MNPKMVNIQLPIPGQFSVAVDNLHSLLPLQLLQHVRRRQQPAPTEAEAGRALEVRDRQSDLSTATEN